MAHQKGFILVLVVCVLAKSKEQSKLILCMKASEMILFLDAFLKLNILKGGKCSFIEHENMNLLNVCMSLASIDSIVRSMSEFFKGFLPSELVIFIISLFPVLELRGGIIAARLLHVHWLTANVICVLGNLVPIPFILLFVNKIFDALRNTRFVKFIDKIEEKARKKSKNILKYERFGLFLFVAIPFPGTGAWTGALVASIFKMKMKDTVISILAGVATAAFVMSLICYIIPYIVKCCF